jgi:hypothetical protein
VSGLSHAYRSFKHAAVPPPRRLSSYRSSFRSACLPRRSWNLTYLRTS